MAQSNPYCLEVTIPKCVLLPKDAKLCHVFGLLSVPFPLDDMLLRSVKPKNI